MDRGLQLACEQCDFSATLYERIPFVVDADGLQKAMSTTRTPLAGYWTDSLCGECRLPVRVAQWIARMPQGTVDVPMCPRCGAELIPFEGALRALAEACHSRAWIDLAAEREARSRIEAAIERSHVLAADIEQGETTTLEALDELARRVSPEGESEGSGKTLDGTHTLDGLGSLVEQSATLDQATSTLEARLHTSEMYLRGLETCVEDEAQLPGVPCPQCGSGHLVHWPVWL